MFSWGGESLSPLIGASTLPSAERPRSRSPHAARSQPTPLNSPSSGMSAGSPSVTGAAATVGSWTTGNINIDVWMSGQLEPEVLMQLSEIPLSKRKSIVIGMMKTPPTNPNSWAKACLRNFREQQFERQVAGGSSPHIRMGSTGSPGQGLSRNYGSPQGHESHGAMMQGPPLSAFADGMLQEVTGGRREGPLFPDLNNTPDRWVSSAWTLWQNSKSNFLAEIHSQLGEVVRHRFQVLPPRDQLHIGFCLMLAACIGRDLDQLVNGWCDRYDSLTNGIVLSPVMGASAPVACSSLSVQFILCGGVLASSNVLVWVAMQCVTSCRPDLRFDLKPVIEVGYREVDVRMARAAFNAKACLPRSDAGIMPCGLDDAVIGFLPEWKEKNTKVIFVIQVPNVPASTNSVPDSDVGQIHGPALRHLFHFRKSIASVTSDLGLSNVATVAFASPDTSDDLRSALSELFGNAVEGVGSTLKYNDFAASPVVFANPVQLSVVKNTSPAAESNKVDGWIFNSEALRSLGSTALPLNPQTLSRNASAHLLGERSLLPNEERLLKIAKMKHEITGELRLPSRDFFGRQLGFEGSPVMKIINEQFKCHPWIIPSTGGAAPPGLKGGEACGQSRYCLECESLFQDLAVVYHLSTCADIVCSCFLKSVMTWQDGRGAQDFLTLPAHWTHHRCGPDCPSNPSRGL
jgi:hypothetical protein